MRSVGEISKMLYWDPIGVGGSASDEPRATADEYDAYARALFAALQKGAAEAELRSILAAARQDDLSLGHDEQAELEVVNRILGESVGRPPR